MIQKVVAVGENIQRPDGTRAMVKRKTTLDTTCGVSVLNFVVPRPQRAISRKAPEIRVVCLLIRSLLDQQGIVDEQLLESLLPNHRYRAGNIKKSLKRVHAQMPQLTDLRLEGGYWVISKNPNTAAGVAE